MSVNIEVKVIPNSGEQLLILDQKTGLFKCMLKSNPEQGKANDELVKILSKAFCVPQQLVHILQGKTSRKKIIKLDVDERTSEELLIQYQLYFKKNRH